MLAILVTLSLFSVALFGQATDSNVVGTVTDSTGAAIAGAAVTALNKDTGVRSATVTNSNGEYRFNNLPVGRYDVSATSKGFNTATIAGLELQLNHTTSANLILQVGTVATAQIQTTYDSRNSDLALAGSSKTINGAGIYNLSLLGAGVASSGGIGQGTGPSVAGQRPENNTFAIDGGGNNDSYSTGPQVYVSNEAVAQMTVAQNQFSAEFGGASGGVFNVIVKSGTNTIHGAIFEYMQNRKLNAVDYSQVVAGNRSNPRYDFNRLGAGIGGPIIKDKLFYYGNFEYAPLGQASVPGQPVDAPTAAGISALNAMSGLSKTNLGVFEKYVPVATSVDATNPSTTVKGVNIPLGALTFASPNYNNSYHAIVAIDYNMSVKDQIRGRYIYDKSVGLDPNANLPVFFQPNPAVITRCDERLLL